MSRVLGQGALNETEAFTNMIEALKVASSSARQLAYYRSDKDWLLVENGLEVMRQRVTSLATAKLRRGAF